MPISPNIRAEISLTLSLFTISLIANLGIIALVVKHWAEVMRSPTSTLSFNLIIGGSIFALAGVPINISKLARDELNYTGSLPCQVEGAFLTFGGAATIMGNVTIAFERYFVILRNRKMSLGDIARLSACSWIWIITLAFLPVVLPDGPYVLQSPQVYCLGEWWGTKPTVLFAVYLDTLTCVGGLIFISYVYGSIGLLVYRQRKKLERAKVISITKPISLKKSVRGKEDLELGRGKSEFDNLSQVKIQVSYFMNSLDGENPNFSEILLAPPFSDKHSSSEKVAALRLLETIPSSEKTLTPQVSANTLGVPSSNNLMAGAPKQDVFSISKKDHEIYFKVVCIASGYVFFWGPYGVIMVTGIFARSMTPPAYCITAGLLAVLSPAVNALLIGLLDPVYKKYLDQAAQYWIPRFRRQTPEL